MRRTSALFGLIALALALCLPPTSEAQCLKNALGKILHPFKGGAQASACYSTQASYGASCYSTQTTITYQPAVQYRVQAIQACGPQGCSVQYVQPTAQTYQYLQAPAKSTPQSQPQIPQKSTPQTSMNDAAPPPPRAPDSFSFALPQPPPPDEGEAVPVPAPVVVVATDPYGYQPLLNGFRARFGLRPVRYNANLTAWAYQNSLRGFGHSVMGPARRQNAAWGQRDAATVESDWENSPGHRSALLDPSVTDYGISMVSNVWTLDLQ